MVRTRKRLGEMLIDAGLIDRATLEETLVKHRSRNVKLGECLIQEGIITENKIVIAVAKQLGVDQFNRAKYPPDPAVRSLIPEELALQYNLVPVQEKDGVLYVAMTDPTDIIALDRVSQKTGQETEPLICNKQQLSWLNSAIYGLGEEEDSQEPTRIHIDEKLLASPPEHKEDQQGLPSLGAPSKGPANYLEPTPEVSALAQSAYASGQASAGKPEDQSSAFLRDKAEGLLAAKTLNVFKQIVAACVEQEGADFHISGNHPVVLRKRGKIFIQKDIFWKFDEVEALAQKLMNEKQLAILEKRKSVDFSLSMNKIFLRIHVAQMARGLSLSFRLLPGKPPSIDSLNLHPSIKDFCELHSGLVVMCGATGTGKTSTLASMIDYVNRSRNAHIITLEDPIEYRHQSIRSFIEQREYRVHFLSFEQALQDVLRQMPDVIFVGEMRDPEVIRETLNVAESGHLVLATMHASSPEEAVYRICNSFPMDSQDLVRHQLSAVLRGVIVQRLTQLPDMNFRVPLLSILRSNQALKNSLRENKMSQIDSIVEMGFQEGMFSFRRYLTDFLEKKQDFTPPAKWFSSAGEPS